MKKRAKLVAAAIVVLCPHCSAEQPSPGNGSDMWTPDEVKAASGDSVRVCVSCDEEYYLWHSLKVATE